MISVLCPTCGNAFEVPPALAGQAAECTDCGELVRVPVQLAPPKWWEKFRPAVTISVIVAVIASVAIAAGLSFTRRTHEATPQMAAAPAVAMTNPVAAPESESQSVALRRSHAAPSRARSAEKMHSQMALEHEGVRVAIGLVSIDHVPIDDHGTPDETEKEYLMIGLNLSNKTSGTLNYSGWGHAEGVSLVDNLGNHYGRVHAPSGTAIIGQRETASMISGRSVTDMLAFKPPSEQAEYLTLELPAANFGSQGTLTFRIVRFAWLKNNDGG